VDLRTWGGGGGKAMTYLEELEMSNPDQNSLLKHHCIIKHRREVRAKRIGLGGARNLGGGESQAYYL